MPNILSCVQSARRVINTIVHYVWMLTIVCVVLFLTYKLSAYIYDAIDMPIKERYQQGDSRWIYEWSNILGLDWVLPLILSFFVLKNLCKWVKGNFFSGVLYTDRWSNSILPKPFWWIVGSYLVYVIVNDLGLFTMLAGYWGYAFALLLLVMSTTRLWLLWLGAFIAFSIRFNYEIYRFVEPHPFFTF